MSKRPRTNKVEQAMAANLDKLAAYESFCEEVLPSLRSAVTAGKSADDIYKLVESVAAARTATIAIKEKDSAKALAAIKEILDRSKGKAKERHEHEHKYAKLKTEELDSLILSEMSDVDDEDLVN